MPGKKWAHTVIAGRPVILDGQDQIGDLISHCCHLAAGLALRGDLQHLVLDHPGEVDISQHEIKGALQRNLLKLECDRTLETDALLLQCGHVRDNVDLVHRADVFKHILERQVVEVEIHSLIEPRFDLLLG